MNTIPKATHVGELKFGDIVIQCAVLEDGTRVLSQRGFLSALGRAKTTRKETGVNSPVFLAAKNLNPFIGADLEPASTPIVFRYHGKALGYRAELLPRVCNVFLKARDAGVLLPSQKHIAQQCDFLIRGLAEVGIIALIDEATGYQKDRKEDELRKILEAYISPELRPWQRRFPEEYYREIFRLSGLQYDPLKRPGFVGHLTNQIIYEQLPGGVLEELRRKNPERKVRHHQFLTGDIGCPHLERQLTKVVTAMQLSTDWWDFWRKFNKLPSPNPRQLELGIEPPEETPENVISLDEVRETKKGGKRRAV